MLFDRMVCSMLLIFPYCVLVCARVGGWVLLSNSPCSDYVYVLLAILSNNNHNTVRQNIVKMISICLCTVATHETHLRVTIRKKNRIILCVCTKYCVRRK